MKYFLFCQLLLVALASAELRIDLGGDDWSVTNLNGSINIPAKVPGGIYTDLRAANIISTDLHYRFNDLDLRWVSNDDWIYRKSFIVDSTILNGTRVELVMHGVDTVATVILNDVQILTTDNQFIKYAVPVKDVLKEGENILEIQFISAITEARKRFDDQALSYVVPPVCVPDEYRGECHVNHLRKMQASFSWDWGPAFPSVGLWKKIELISHTGPIVTDILSTTEEGPDRWDLTLTYFLQCATENEVKLEVSIALDLMVLNEITYKNCAPMFTTKFQIAKDAVKRWWPQNYGSQPLYNVTVVAIGAGQTSSKRVKIGFRTIELIQEPIQGSEGAGLSFYLVVNGIPVFSKGANWIPLDVLSDMSVDPKKIQHLLRSAKEANMNMIRIWGGGYYESDTFYEVSDELGLMVWQDFAFACSMYPTNPEFLSSVQTEVDQQVKRLQHHASLVLWSGNNENEGALRDNWYGTGNNFELYKADYIKLYVDTIREGVKALDPGRPFVLSSPTNGLQSEAEGYVAQQPGSRMYGDIHYYNYVIDGWQPSAYPIPRFASEYGFQSFPSFLTISNITVSEDWSAGSAFTQSRQHHPGGNQEIKLEIDMNLPMPSDWETPENFQTFIYYSQINQAMSTKVETEHYRRHQTSIETTGEGRTMGALYWQLNDVWEAPTWASIDYTGRWKMLHYFAKRFFSDSLVSGYVKPDGQFVVYLTSDNIVDLSPVVLRIHVYNWNSLTPIYEEIMTTTLVNSSSVAVKSEDVDAYLRTAGCFSPDDNLKHACFFYLTLRTESGLLVSPDNFIFPAPLKNAVGIEVPALAINKVTGPTQGEYNTFIVTITTDAIAPFVWLETVISGHFSDNGFLLVKPLKEVMFYTEVTVTADELKNSLTITSMMHHAAKTYQTYLQKIL